MKIVNSEQNIFFDVDDTLVMHEKAKKGDKVVQITDPYDGSQHFLVVHQAHVKVLKDRKSRGATIFVWSQGGYEWANAVVCALGLESHVDYVLSKPVMHVDDLPAKEWMGERLYLSTNSKYGQL